MEKQVADIENLKAPKIEVYFDSQDKKKDLQIHTSRGASLSLVKILDTITTTVSPSTLLTV